MDYEWEKLDENIEEKKPEQTETGFTMGQVTEHTEAADELNKFYEAKQEREAGAESANTGESTVQSERTAFEETEAPAAGKKKKKKKGRERHEIRLVKKLAIIFTCVIVFGAAAGATFFGIQKLFGDSGNNNNGNGGNQVVENPTEEPTEESTKADSSNIGKVVIGDYDNDNSLDVTDLVEATMPSLVQITNIEMVDVSYYNDPFYYFFGGQQGSSGEQQAQTSLGSGVIIGKSDTELFIVTNAHVVEDADELVINFYDEESVDAYVKGSDEDVDIALVAVKLDDMKQTTMDCIRIAEFGDSTKVRIGQQVVAIGNAMGYGQSVTTGIVSAVNREFSTSTALLIQTDAAINPGNSGGALFNMNGEVIGINNSKVATTNVEGMGYSIPSSTVEPMVEEYKNAVVREKVASDEAGYIGIKGIDVDESMSSYYGIPVGIYISEVVDDGPCDKAGIPEKSIITKFDGKSVETMTELKEILAYYKKGETVKLTIQVYDNGEYVSREVEITLAGAQESQQISDTPTSPAQNMPYQRQNEGTEG